MRVRRSFLAWLTAATILAGCSIVPNMDAGSAGCQNATGIGVASNDAPEVMAEVGGLSAADAASRLEAKRSHGGIQHGRRLLVRAASRRPRDRGLVRSAGCSLVVGRWSRPGPNRW